MGGQGEQMATQGRTTKQGRTRAMVLPGRVARGESRVATALGLESRDPQTFARQLAEIDEAERSAETEAMSIRVK